MTAPDQNAPGDQQLRPSLCKRDRFDRVRRQVMLSASVPDRARKSLGSFGQGIIAYRTASLQQAQQALGDHAQTASAGRAGRGRLGALLGAGDPLGNDQTFGNVAGDGGTLGVRFDGRRN